MIEWAGRKYLYGLLIIPLLLFSYWMVYRWRRKARAAFVDRRFYTEIFPKASETFFWIKAFLKTGTIFLIIVALADPLLGSEMKKIERQSIDIIYALDVSKSMAAEDVFPNRLDKAKNIILQTLRHLSGNRVCLMIYAGLPYVLLPFTTDYGALKTCLEVIDFNAIPDRGTSIAACIRQAVELSDHNQETGKTLVIFSDGEDHEENVENALDMAKDHGLRLYVIGIGTVKGAPIPQREKGVLTAYKKDATGQVIVTRLNRQLLSELAQETGGEYIEEKGVNRVVERLKKALSKEEKTPRQSAYARGYKHHFQIFLAIALVLLFLDVFLEEPRVIR